MLSIKFIYAFWQTSFCLLSNVNMIATKYNVYLGSPNKSMGKLRLAWKAIHIGLPMQVTGGNALGRKSKQTIAWKALPRHSPRPACGCPHGQHRQHGFICFKNTNRANRMWTKASSKKRKLQSPEDSSVCSVLSVCDIMKDQGKAFQAIAFLHALPRTSSSLSFRVCTRLPTSASRCVQPSRLVVATISH